jgi:uncharacterized damage-inducible protein DinB
MTQQEYDAFLKAWDVEAAKAVRLMQALPKDKYDFRPDPGGRSLGELAWHLAEGDAYMTLGVSEGNFDMGKKPPGIERPKQVEALAPGYERIHADAVARIRKMSPSDLDKQIKFFDGTSWRGGDILWNYVLYHHIHHRGQLSVLCRIAGGASPGVFGPNREEWEVMKAQMAARK